MSDISETLGRRLQAAREKKGLSAQKAADELHLDSWVIDGLESGNYERIGPPVYAKGHLKRYAELLGLPVADVLADFDGAPVEIPAVAQPAGMRMRTSTPGGRELPWAWILGGGVAVLVLAGLLSWWRPWHPRGTAAAPASADAVAPTAAASGAGQAGQPLRAGAGTAPLPAGVAGSGMAAGSAGSGAAPVGAAAGTAAAGAAGSGGTASVAAAADPKAASGRARLRLSFLADSWVDVHDATGQRLFAGTGHVNNVRSMSGEAPFRVYLKSASSIRMEINNHVVAIAPQFVVADAAHFEAGADGVLRRDLRAVPTK